MKERKSLSEELIQRQVRARESRNAIIRNREQIQREKEEKISSLHEAVSLGYPSAVERILTNTNVNEIEKGKTPFTLVKECILQENNRTKLRSYYTILNQLVKAGADTSGLTEKERHMIYHLCPSILLKTPLPRSEPSGITASTAHRNLPAKFAIDVFDEQHNNFNIGQLQRIPLRNLDEHLYDDEDFTVEISDGRGWGSRSEIGVKLGSIYIQYQPMGKGGYAATIYSIDKKAHKLTMLQEFDGERKSGIDFDGIVPFDLSTFYACMTCAGGSADLIAVREAYYLSYDVKMNLINLALGKETPAFYIVTNLTHEQHGTLNSRNIVGIAQEKENINDLFFGRALSIKKNEGFVVYKIIDATAIMPQMDSSVDLSQFEKVEIGLYSPVKNDEIDFRPLPNLTEGRSFFGSQLGSFQGSMIKVKDNARRNQAKPEVPPEEFYCMINTGEIMKDPVTTIEGQTYEREAIETWFNRCRSSGRKITDPATGVELTSTTLIPNRNLQDAIQQWEIKHPQLPEVPKKPSFLASLRTTQGEPREKPAATQRVSLFSQLKKEQEKLRMEKESGKQPLAREDKEKVKDGDKEKEKEVGKTSEKGPQDIEEAPLAFESPISGEIMRDPVMTPNGDSYEREDIVAWLNKEPSDPKTRARISVDDLVTNYALKSLIENWQKTHAAKPDEASGLRI